MLKDVKIISISNFKIS